MITIEVRDRIISFLRLLIIILFHIWTILFPIKDRVQLVVQIVHFMLKIHYLQLSLCKLLM